MCAETRLGSLETGRVGVRGSFPENSPSMCRAKLLWSRSKRRAATLIPAEWLAALRHRAVGAACASMTLAEAPAPRRAEDRSTWEPSTAILVCTPVAAPYRYITPMERSSRKPAAAVLRLLRPRREPASRPAAEGLKSASAAARGKRKPGAAALIWEILMVRLILRR